MNISNHLAAMSLLSRGEFGSDDDEPRISVPCPRESVRRWLPQAKRPERAPNLAP
jgi:hypothetical protein